MLDIILHNQYFAQHHDIIICQKELTSYLCTFIELYDMQKNTVPLDRIVSLSLFFCIRL